MNEEPNFDAMVNKDYKAVLDMLESTFNMRKVPIEQIDVRDKSERRIRVVETRQA
jgi:hypothetical protein